MGLTAQQKNDQAVAILLRAADKTGWDDHASEKGRRVSSCVEAAFGPTTMLDQAILQDAVLFSHLAGLRGMERSVIADAQAKENAGQVEAGFRERHAILRLGHLMRTQAVQGWAQKSARLSRSRACSIRAARRERLSAAACRPNPHLSQRQAAYGFICSA